jgi:hypothetical protein
VKVTTCDPLKDPLAGEIVAAALVCTELLEVHEFPIPPGEFAGASSRLNQPPELLPGVQLLPKGFWITLLLAVIAPSAPIIKALAQLPWIRLLLPTEELSMLQNSMPSPTHGSGDPDW